jgi:CHAT domain-containing protein
VLQDVKATETALRKGLAGKRYLHIATHGLIDEERANLFAMLVLTPPLEATPPADNDGFLQLHEIYDLDLSSCELAILSACRTNVGRSVRGEGVFALSRGMMVAGARRVIASQWSVNDASTAELIGDLFRQIGAMERLGTLNYAVALRDARRKVRAQKKWSAPRYWAPFVLIGAR